MRTYYQLGTRIEAAECAETAARLEHDGWQRITPAEHAALWAARNIADLQRIEVEDWLSRPARPAPVDLPAAAAPTMGPSVTNVVWPTKSKG